MTRIVCISDTHGCNEFDTIIPDGDILIHAGDFSSVGEEADTRFFLNWFGKRPHKNKVLIGGNHDKYPWEKPAGFAAIFAELCPGAHFLEDQEVTLDGLTVWGAPWSPRFGDTQCYMADRGSAIRYHWDKIPKHVDVLVTHCPPNGFLDLSNNWNEATGEKWDDHLGCRDLYEAVLRTEPLLHVFGHIHGSGGKQQKLVHDDGNKTILVNASCMAEDYQIRHKGQVINL